MKYLKQSTSAVIAFGPALLPADGVTLVTSLVSALDHASTGIFLCKNGAAAAIRHASVTATTYDAYGSYLVTLDTTDTNTLGRIRVMFAAAANTLPMWEDFTVLPANIFDSFVSGTDLFDVSVTQLLGTAWLTPGTAGTPDVNAKLHGGVSQTGRDIGSSVLLSSGSGTGQVTLSSGAISNVINVVNSVVATVSDKTGFSLSSAGIQAIWDALTSALTTVGSIGKLLVTNIDTTISSRGTSTYAGGAVASVTAGVTVTTNNDKAGYALTAGEHTNIVSDVDTSLSAATSELSSVPSSTASLKTIIQFIGQYFRFKRTTTSTTETMYKANSSTSLGTAGISDDGTTATHEKMS